MIEVYSIVVYGNEISETGFKKLVESSEAVGNDFDIRKYAAVTPSTVQHTLDMFNVKWNYPWDGEVVDFASGLVKRAYPTKDRNKRIACALSHYTLWHAIKNQSINAVILEHDAEFFHRLDVDNLIFTPYNITGLNNPLGATRRANQFYTAVLANGNEFQPVPIIDDVKIPQGLAGNSAYYITPTGAQLMIDLVEQYGLWPNDALMCYQLLGKHRIGVTRKFYTKVQGLPSTTTL
jgi:hypothetical protein